METVRLPLKPTKPMVEAMREIEEANGGFSIGKAWTHIVHAATGQPGNYGQHLSDKPEVIDRCTCKICCTHRATTRAAKSEPHPGNEDGQFLPGSCAHCGQFHSSAACPPQPLT